MKILFYLIIALQLLTLFSCANEQLVGHWEQDKNSIHLYNGEILTINHAIFKKGGSGIMWSVSPEDSTSSIGTVDLINWEHINENQISIHSEYWADTIKYKINKDTLFVMDNGGESMVFLKQSSKDNDELFNKIATYIKTPEDIKQEIEQLLKLEP